MPALLGVILMVVGLVRLASYRAASAAGGEYGFWHLDEYLIGMALLFLGLMALLVAAVIALRDRDEAHT